MALTQTQVKSLTKIAGLVLFFVLLGIYQHFR